MFSAKELSIPFLDDPSPLAGEGQLPAARLALPSHLGRFAAQTYGAGAEVRVTSRQGFRAGYYYQNRTQGRREQGVGLSYFVRF